MKITDPTLGLDQKAQMLLTILANRELETPDKNPSFIQTSGIQTRAYYEGGRGWVQLRLIHELGFTKQLTFGKDWKTDQFLIQTWEVSIGAPEGDADDKVLFPSNRLNEVIEFIVRQLQGALEMMQEDRKPTLLERLMRD